MRATHAIPFLVCALLVCGARQAKAGFIAPYGPGNFSLINNGGTNPDGFALFPDSNTLVLTGSNDGSGAPGTTDLLTAAVMNGQFQFDYLYSSLDDPLADYAGYIVGDAFFQIADTDGQTGTISVPVLLGQTFGFRVGTIDNQGEPGVLTVTNFGGSTPEPGTFSCMLLAALGVLLSRWHIRHGTARVSERNRRDKPACSRG